MVEIVPLSKENIDDVCSLTLNVFHNKPEDFDYPPKWFYASLEPSKHKKLFDRYGFVKIKEVDLNGARQKKIFKELRI